MQQQQEPQQQQLTHRNAPSAIVGGSEMESARDQSKATAGDHGRFTAVPTKQHTAGGHGHLQKNFSVAIWAAIWYRSASKFRSSNL